ncbi:hypothetical protein DMH17_00210 [Raoultella planticola]|nr:hypothetical protein [Raoultella planticola]
MSLSLWQQCLARLQDELPATEFSMWIRPLQAELSDNTLALYAPNRFVLGWVGINTSIISMDSSMIFCGADAPQLRFEVRTRPAVQAQRGAVNTHVATAVPAGAGSDGARRANDRASRLG